MGIIDVGQKYLPGFDDCTLTFMLDIIADRKKVLDLAAVTSLTVAKYSEFILESVMDELKLTKNSSSTFLT